MDKHIKTVAELVARLQELPQDALIVVCPYVSTRTFPVAYESILDVCQWPGGSSTLDRDMPTEREQEAFRINISLPDGMTVMQRKKA